MAKSLDEKKSLLKKYKDLFEQSEGYILVDPSGIGSDIVTDLKKKLRELDSTVTVVKNTVFRIAVQDKKDLPAQAADFQGSTAAIFYKTDPTVVAKLVKEIQTKTEKFSPKYGVVDGNYITDKRVMELAEIPSREELLGKLLGSITAPISGFMSVSKGNVRGFTRILSELSTKDSADTEE